MENTHTPISGICAFTEIHLISVKEKGYKTPYKIRRLS